MTDVAGVLLAAGAARRFGSPKLLRSLADGVPVAVAAARALHAALPASVAVVRPGDHALAEAMAAVGLCLVEHPQADRGIGSSLASGVGAVPAASGWLIALADMPWVQTATIHALAQRLRAGASIVAPLYRGQRGHPVGFARCWGDRLCSLDGDVGARGLIAAHPGDLSLHATADAGVLADVDRPDDLLVGR